MSSKNVGWRDAGIRGFLAAVFLLLSASLQSRPLLAVGAGFLGLILLGTALFRMCPLYTLFGIDTARPGRTDSPLPR